MQTKLDVRFTDQDSQGHVHHVAIVEHIAHARVQFIDSLLWDAGIANLDYTLARLEVDFISPIKHPGEVIVRPKAESVGDKSFTVTYKLLKDGEQFAFARSLTVFFDKKTGKSVRVPEALR